LSEYSSEHGQWTMNAGEEGAVFVEAVNIRAVKGQPAVEVVVEKSSAEAYVGVVGQDSEPGGQNIETDDAESVAVVAGCVYSVLTKLRHHLSV